jgi:hypothetical protein
MKLLRDTDMALPIYATESIVFIVTFWLRQSPTDMKDTDHLGALKFYTSNLPVKQLSSSLHALEFCLQGCRELTIILDSIRGARHF